MMRAGRIFCLSLSLAAILHGPVFAQGPAAGGSTGALPSQGGNANKTLTTDGSNASWTFGCLVIDQVTANTTIDNTAAETPLYTFNVPANLLGTGRKLRLTLLGESSNANSTTFTWRFKYGATTLGTSTAAPTGGVTGADTRWMFELNGDGATNAQLGQFILVIGPAAGGAVATHHIVRGTAAIDSTIAQTMVITLQVGVAVANNGAVMEHATLEAC